MRALFSVLAAVILASFATYAGAVYTNDTGQPVYGIRIEFTEPVEVTGHANTFLVQSSEGEATSFTFSGGELLPGESFWLSWSPASAGVLRYEWLTAATGTASKTATSSSALPEAHSVRKEYTAQFVGPHGEIVEVNALRETSREVIPFTASYRLELPHAYKAVALVDDPGLFTFPDKEGDLGSVLVPAMKIDDFNDIDKVSGLGTTWSFEHIDPRIDAFEVGKTAFGYGLMFNGDNGVSLNLDGVNAASFKGLYMMITASGDINGGTGIQQLSVRVDDLRHLLQDLPIMMDPELYRIPFSDRLKSNYLFELELALDVNNHPWAGITVYDIGFYTTLYELVAGISPAPRFDFDFTFDTNSTEHNIRFLLVDDSGELFTYQESLDFPLHNETEILFDAERVFVGESIVSASWRLRNVDPLEDVTLNGIRVSYESEWPDVRDITVRASTSGGETLEKRFYGLVYWRDGCPIPRRGFQAINPFIYPAGRFKAVTQKLELAKELGYNMMSYQVFWHYGWPDGNGNFTLRPIPTDDARQQKAQGWTLSDDGLRKLLGAAKEEGFGVAVQLLQYPYGDDSALNSEYPHWGGGDRPGCFRCNEHFLYGDGEGYWNQLMHHKGLFSELDVDVVVFGAEVGKIEWNYYSEVREFYSDAAEEWDNFGGEISYAVCDFSPGAPLRYNAYNPRTNRQVLNPSVSSIPFEEMDMVALTEYQILATSADSGVEEMYNRAVSWISGYMREFHEAYDKPLYIADLVIAAYEDVLLAPPGDRQKMLSSARDDAAQIKYYLAWLRAFSHAIRDMGYDWISGIIIGSFQMRPDQEFLGSLHIDSISGGLKVTEGNLKPRLLDTFRVYLSDRPVED